MFSPPKKKFAILFFSSTSHLPSSLSHEPSSSFPVRILILYFLHTLLFLFCKLWLYASFFFSSLTSCSTFSFHRNCQSPLVLLLLHLLPPSSPFCGNLSVLRPSTPLPVVSSLPHLVVDVPLIKPYISTDYLICSTFTHSSNAIRGSKFIPRVVSCSRI